MRMFRATMILMYILVTPYISSGQIIDKTDLQLISKGEIEDLMLRSYYGDDQASYKMANVCTFVLNDNIRAYFYLKRASEQGNFGARADIDKLKKYKPDEYERLEQAMQESDYMKMLDKGGEAENENFDEGQGQSESADESQ